MTIERIIGERKTGRTTRALQVARTLGKRERVLFVTATMALHDRVIAALAEGSTGRPPRHIMVDTAAHAEAVANVHRFELVVLDDLGAEETARLVEALKPAAERFLVIETGDAAA